MPAMKFERSRATGPASSMSGSRRSNSSNITLNLEPRQVRAEAEVRAAGPEGDVRVRIARRHRRRRRRGIRPRPGWPSRSRWRPCRPRGSAAPRIAVSLVTVRRKYMTGVTQRSISSTAVPISDGSAISFCRCSGCSISASMPPEIRLRVVSLPATASRRKNASNSVSVSALAVHLRLQQRADHVVAAGSRVGPPQAVRVHEHLRSRHRPCSGVVCVLGVVEADQPVAPFEDLVAVLVRARPCIPGSPVAAVRPRYQLRSRTRPAPHTRSMMSFAMSRTCGSIA